MARVKGAMMTRKRRNKILKMAKGYWGAKSKHFKMANEQVMKSLTYAYRLIIFFTVKDGEALYSQQKQDRELTVAQIMNCLLPNSDLN